ncbi:MAG: hypothetical protein ABH828_04760 [archaeon]
MAVTGLATNLPSLSAPNNSTIITVVAIGALILLVYYFVKHGKRTAEYGTRGERRQKRRAGIDRPEKIIYDLEKKDEEREKEDKKLEKDEKDVLKDAASKDDKGEFEEGEAVEEGLEAERQEEKAVKATEAIEGRGEGAAAATKNLVDSIVKFAEEEERDEIVEEKEEQDVEKTVAEIDELVKRLSKLKNMPAVDREVRTYLHKFLDRLVNDFKVELKEEKNKEVLIKARKVDWRRSIIELGKSIKGAEKEESRLNKAEKKERKDFSKELKDIEKSLNQKRKQLRKARKKDKDADKTLISNLGKEISMLETQASRIRNLNGELKNTFKSLDRENKEMKKLLKMIQKNDKHIKKSNKTLDKRGKEIRERYRKLDEEFEKIRNNMEIPQNASPHVVALNFSENLNKYTDAHLKITEEDEQFNEGLKEFIAKVKIAAKQLEAFFELEKSTTESESAVEEGMAAMEKLLEGVVGSNESKVNIDEELNKIIKSFNDLKIVEKIEDYMEKFEKSIEEEIDKALKIVEKDIEKDKEIIQEIEKTKKENSEHLGSAMAIMMNQKVKLDEKYMSEATNFENKLNQRNNVAGQAYKQGRRY